MATLPSFASDRSAKPKTVRPSPGGAFEQHAGGREAGPLPAVAGDKSVICSDPEWVRYWQRHGVYGPVCNTQAVLGDLLRRLQRSWSLVVDARRKHDAISSRAERFQQGEAALAERLRRHRVRVRQLDARRVSMEQAIAELQGPPVPGQPPAPPEEKDRLVERLEAERRRCDDLEASDAGARTPSTVVSLAHQTLTNVRDQVVRLTADVGEANRRLKQYERVVHTMVTHLLKMGYSMASIQRSMDPAQEEHTRAFLDPNRHVAPMSVPPTPDPLKATSTEMTLPLLEQVQHVRVQLEQHH